MSYLHLLQTKLKETRQKKRPPHERNAKIKHAKVLVQKETTVAYHVVDNNIDKPSKRFLILMTGLYWLAVRLTVNSGMRTFVLQGIHLLLF